MLRNLEVVPSTESWSELLDWVNRSMPVEAPNHNKTPAMHKVEECGHGVPYVLMLPSMLPIIHLPLLTSKVKVPSRTDYEAVANLKLMQDALRRNGIVVPNVLANDSQKLIGRNFQANLQLLQWFRGLYVALQQCGIEAGEGRIVLEAPDAGDDLSSIDSPPASVVKAEERRRTKSLHCSLSAAGMQQDVEAAEAQGNAAAAAAVALLSVSRSRTRSHEQSLSRHTPFDSAVAPSRQQSQPHSATLRRPPSASHQQAMPSAKRGTPNGSAVRPRGHDSNGGAASSEWTREVESPPPAPPAGEPRASTGPRTIKKAAPGAAAGTAQNAPATRHASAAASARPSGRRTPRAAARPSTAGSGSVVFKAVPAQISSLSASVSRRSEGKGGRTPREAARANGVAREARAAAPAKQKSAQTRPSAPAAETPVPAHAPAAAAAAARGAADASPAEADVAQLQLDRQFYYDKLRHIEELVKSVEAKKEAERRTSPAAWGSKDEEMLDFASSVRTVLYAES